MSDSHAQDQFAQFFDRALDLLCIAGFDGYLKELNGAWESTLGHTAKELKSRPLIEFVHPDDRVTTLRESEQLARGVDSIRFRNRFRTSGGGYRWR